MAITGKPIDRVDGRLKVTGAAIYAAEFNQPNMAYAFPVRSTIAKGRITAIDTVAAASAAGVLTIFTHKNAPRLKPIDLEDLKKYGGYLTELLLPLQDAGVHYFGQFIALVIAETYEQARAGAALLKVKYQKLPVAIELEKELPKGFKAKIFFSVIESEFNVGDVAGAIDAAPVKVERTYRTSTENHHPMEPHASIAVWETTGKLIIYDSTSGLKASHGKMASILGLELEQVQIISKFVGGSFGGKGGWMYQVMAAMAARVVKRPVKIVLTRQMMQTNVGRRGATVQRVTLPCGRDGKLTAIRHLTDTYTNLLKDTPPNPNEYFEASGLPTKVLYGAPNREIGHQVARLNVGVPNPMRAPGEASGSFAVESAMDELAVELKIDPITLRLINFAEADPLNNLPWSSNFLKDCYRIGAERFGWERRNALPRSTRQGRYLVGMGMATATYRGNRAPASVKVQMWAEGSVVVQSAAEDIGTGTYTIMTQTAADALGLPVERIKIEIGDSNLPPSPGSGGAQMTASVNPAVLAACEMLRGQLLELAIADKNSKLAGRKPAEITFANAVFLVSGDSSKSDSYTDIMRRNGKTIMEACATTVPASSTPVAPCMVQPTASEENSDVKKISFHSFGAQFAEVWVDEDLSTISVKRFTSVQDVGRIMNEKTARSQIIGGVIFGIGQALMEETVYDNRWANPVTRSLADYHVPVQMDVPEIDVHFIGKPDLHISPIGARGVGEIGNVGVAAAIANAVFNATGKRLRNLPLTLDKLM